MLELIREFKFGRPQQFAAMMLLACMALLTLQLLKVEPDRAGSRLARTESRDLALSTSLLYRSDAIFARTPDGASAQCLTCDSILEIRVSQLQILLFELLHLRSRWPSEAAFIRWCRIPFAIFALWLASALWWVTRRLYNDRGGYVALALFCFSLPMITAGAHVNADILAAWGLFGFIYTAIGVAHTLYAPPRKWRPRILLLGIALGVTATAHLSAALLALALGAAFMLYLAPGRRLAGLVILLVASGIGICFLWALAGFHVHTVCQTLSAWPQWGFTLAVPHIASFRKVLTAAVFAPQTMLLAALFLAALVTFLVWRWSRYFGNLAPLLALTVIMFVRVGDARVWIWALPFVFTFIGGMFADLMESKRGDGVRSGVWVAMTAYATLAFLTIWAAH